MKKALAIVTFVIVLVIGLIRGINASAEDFDASWYANRYPDVVNELGNDPSVLLNHYNTFGIKEGRFKNAQEESTGIPSTEPVIVEQKVQEQKPVLQGATVEELVEPIAGYSTYVDVNIELQIVAYFENGENKLQTPCVTGNSKNHSTPTGTYSIITKVPGKYLVGPTWKCWVDRWMQFTDDHIGFHDASWRSDFGGNIYQGNGSHGCVNLPKDAAYSLYDMVSVGTTVVVH